MAKKKNTVRTFTVILTDTKTMQTRIIHGVTVKGLYTLFKIDDDTLISIIEMSSE